jgi:hypothetical protein
MANCPMPDAPKVRAMLGMLFDGLDIKPGKKFDIVPASGSWVGAYVGDDGAVLAACAVDVALAANTGAALSMMPPGVAKDAIKAKDLSEVMVANVHEVMNICTRLMMTEGSPHLRLSKLYPAKTLPADVAQMLAGAKGRIDFELSVPKYGVGTLSFIST